MSEENKKRMRCESTDGPFCDEMVKNLQSSMSVRSDTAVGLLGFGSHKPALGFYDRVSLRGRPDGDLYLIPFCPFCGARIDGGEEVAQRPRAAEESDDDLNARLHRHLKAIHQAREAVSIEGLSVTTQSNRVIVRGPSRLRAIAEERAAAAARTYDWQRDDVVIEFPGAGQ